MEIPNKPSDNQAAIGCFMLALVVFGGAVIIEVLHTVMYFVVIVGAVGGIGFLLYKASLYDQRTGNLTAWMERTFDLNNRDGYSSLPPGVEETLTLPEAEEDKLFLGELQSVKEELEVLHQQRSESEHRMIQTSRQMAQEAAENATYQTKKDVLGAIYGDNRLTINEWYARSDEYEKQREEEKARKQREEIERERHEVTMERRFLDQDGKILDLTHEVREEVRGLKLEISQIGERLMRQELEFKTALLQVMQTVSDLKSYVDEKFNSLHIHMLEQLTACREMITMLRAEYKEEMSATKLQFGKEILRIDQNAGTIINKLESYHNELKSVSLQVEKVRMEGQRNKMETSMMFERARTLYERNRLQMESHSSEIGLQLKEIAVQRGDFANAVGRAKMTLDHQAHELDMNIKSLGYEKMGIEAARRDFQTRQDLEYQKGQMLRSEIAHQSQMLQEKMSRGEQVAGLQHQIQMTQGRLVHSEQRLGLLRQENAFVRRVLR
jgi:hypothetical protein